MAKRDNSKLPSSPATAERLGQVSGMWRPFVAAMPWAECTIESTVAICRHQGGAVSFYFRGGRIGNRKSGPQPLGNEVRRWQTIRGLSLGPAESRRRCMRALESSDGGALC